VRKSQNTQIEDSGKIMVMIIVVLVVAVKVIPLVGGGALLFLYLFRKQI